MRLRLLVAAVVLTACGDGGGAVATAPTAPATTATTTGEAPPGTRAEVVAVLDGDSLVVRIGSDDEEVRLLGINAPEPGECHADESRSTLAAAVGREIVIVAAGDATRDQFGRLLAYVYQGSRNLNQWLLSEGAAIAMAAKHPLRPEFLAADEEAWSRGVGMWARGVCRPAVDPGIFVFDLEFDAPGRDDENPNGEFVVLGNTGPAVSIAGWILRDESSTHRYEFPNGTAIATGEFLIIRTGCGTDAAGELHWCAAGSVWNNDGDTAMLSDATGAIVTRWRYLGS
ncbi:MAG TPA: hypothetical protein DCY40_02520 [Actinobacteria bacterium]|nr:hypothetical protein [Actinomycetota bacterium]